MSDIGHGPRTVVALARNDESRRSALDGRSRQGPDVAAEGRAVTDPSADSGLVDALQSLVSDKAAARYADLLDGTNEAGADDPAIDELVQAGLVGVLWDTGEPFLHPPRIALTRAAQSAAQDWLAQAPDFEALTTLVNTNVPANIAPIVPSEVDDLRERQQAVEALAMGAVEELAVLQPYDEELDADDAGEWTSQADAAMPGRITWRTVYDERLFGVPNFGQAIHEEVALGAHVRITGTPLPGFLLIADRAAAAYTPAPDAPGRITSESSLVELLYIAFEATWSAATPFGHTEDVSDDHMTVLTLVGLGHTNRQIGSMLGLNERTIRRRVNDLLDHFGEVERAALVRHAHMAAPGS